MTLLPKSLRLLVAATAFCLCVSCGESKRNGSTEIPTWIAAMAATIEDEHIGRGDSIRLSTTYLVRMILQDRAHAYFSSDGEEPINLEGTPADFLRYLSKHGVVPLDSYEGRTDVNYSVLCKKVKQLCDDALHKHRDFPQLTSRLDDLLDEELGIIPGKFVHLYRAEYTPLEFAHSVCYPGEYISLSLASNPHKALATINKAVSHNHPVCGEGEDILVEIIGTTEKDGKPSYVCKTAWQPAVKKQPEPLHLSEEELLLRLSTVYLSKDAVAP